MSTDAREHFWKSVPIRRSEEPAADGEQEGSPFASWRIRRVLRGGDFSDVEEFAEVYSGPEDADAVASAFAVGRGESAMVGRVSRFGGVDGVPRDGQEATWKVAAIHATESGGEPGSVVVRNDLPPMHWSVRRVRFGASGERITEIVADVHTGPEDAWAVAETLAARGGEAVERT